MTILAATAWANNGKMIADVARLGWLRESDHVLDPTWAAPDDPLHHDRQPIDYTAMPWADSTFDAVAFDPPYVTPGGRKTSTLPDYQDRRP